MLRNHLNPAGVEKTGGAKKVSESLRLPKMSFPYPQVVMGADPPSRVTHVFTEKRSGLLHDATSNVRRTGRRACHSVPTRIKPSRCDSANRYWRSVRQRVI